MPNPPNPPSVRSAPTSWRALVRGLLAPVPRAADPPPYEPFERRDRRAALSLGAAAVLTLAVPAFAKDAPKGNGQADDNGDDDDDDKKGGAKDDKGPAGKAQDRKAQDGKGTDATSPGSKADAKDAKKADDDDDDETQAEKAADRFPQPVVVGSLLRRTVLQPEESQPVLGHVADIVRAKDGTLSAVVNYGGFLGFDTRPIAVPIDAMALLGEDMEILDFTPEQLKGFPTFDPAGTTPVPHSETIRVALVKPAH